MKNLLKKSGFSLIEVLILSGVISIIAIAMSQLLKSNSEVIHAVETKLRADEFTEVVRASLEEPLACMNALPAASFDSGTREVNTNAATELVRVIVDNADFEVSSIAQPGLEISGLEIQGPQPAGGTEPGWNFLIVRTSSNTVSSYINISFRATSGPAPFFVRRVPIHFEVTDASLPTATITNCSSDAARIGGGGGPTGVRPVTAPEGTNIVSTRWLYEGHGHSGGCNGGDLRCQVPESVLRAPPWAPFNGHPGTNHGTPAPPWVPGDPYPHTRSFPQNELCDPNLKGRRMCCREPDSNDNSFTWRCTITDY